MSKIFFCPRCGEENNTCNYRARYTEYGYEYGSFDGDDHDRDDSESRDYENDEYEYMCKSCDHEFDIDECYVEEGSEEHEELKAQFKGEPQCLPNE